MINPIAEHTQFFDFTKETDIDRIDELEAEVERLNEVVTTLVYRSNLKNV